MALQGYILIADDHPLFRMALKQAVMQSFPQATVVEAESIDQLEKTTESNQDFSLLLLDLNMPGAHGFSGLIYLRDRYQDTPLIVVSASEEAHVIYKALEFGANGFIPKSAALDEMVAAIDAICRGERWWPANVMPQQNPLLNDQHRDLAKSIASLTPQQFRVLGMLAEGQLNKQIAYELNVSEATIKAHMTAIFRKLGVRNRTQAVIRLQQLDVEYLPVPGTE
ncbi:response regulator transcription factor [Ketobacter sp. MCCC 1A13808]|uniref:response regulator n=1 Tax=Ketobacter sp. MCCC 1A13808 TaxID=2602738 RepID=UPI000F29A556|nr:response regulator transcription factor [Ketobacter sp. MCCC 1A13808]MVF11928.1 response regulator transcription factor [Ketobacter sp. MCCC 1A13808]RLP52874.1 MAG: DNA-binding response regulator [Ketobacter sp.]